MKKIILLSLVMLSVIFVASCKKSSDNASNTSGSSTNSDVRVTTYTPQDITATTAKCGGDAIVTQGLTLTEIGVCWNTNGNPVASDYHLSTETWNESFVCTLTGLEPETKYYVRAYALRGLEYYYGECKCFTSSSGELPTVTTSEVTNIMKYSATGGGCVTSDGGVPVIEQGICWSVRPNPTIQDTHNCCYDGLGSFSVNMTGLEQNTLYYVRAYATNYYGVSYGSQISFTTLNPPPVGTYNGHDYIDLGLPSGTLWATCNIGAITPEDYGDYYAWGETESKTAYTWDNYKYCFIDNNVVFLTKYCYAHGYNGFVDNLNILQPIDDAATVHWGEGWCIPSPDQWRELRQNTTITWINQDGVEGELFTSNNGNSLFIPAAHANSYNTGNNCRYWSNYCYDYEACENYLDFFGRYLGFSVRPVRSTE